MLSGPPPKSAPPATTVEFLRAGYRLLGLIPIFPDLRELDLLDPGEDCVSLLDFADDSSSISSSSKLKFLRERLLGGIADVLGRMLSSESLSSISKKE
jgi:hypothetical protein